MRLRDVAEMLLLAALWGASFLFMRVAAPALGPVWLIGIRVLLLAYILYFRLIQNLGATRALTVTYLIPLFAMLWGALALGEAVTLAMALGCGLVLLGTAIANNLVASSQPSGRGR